MVNVLALFLDGFGYNYINQDSAPFLSSIKNENYLVPLKTVLGFSSSIKATIWTSTYSHTHGLWTYWGHIYNRTNEPPWLYKIFKIIPIKKLRIFMRHVMRYFLTRINSPSLYWFLASVDDYIAPFFTRISPEITSDIEINGIKTLFGMLKDKHIPYIWVETKKYEIPQIILNNKDNDIFEVIFMPNFDMIGHRYGPFSPEIIAEVKKLDTFIEEILKKYGNIKDFHFMIFSDHGMAKVKRRVDIKKNIEQLSLIETKDYLAFYDSTFARFWFFNQKAKKLINQELLSLDCGKIIMKKDKKRLGINFTHNWYGDIIFLVNPGYEIFPNYFASLSPTRLLENRLKIKGMHGYHPDHPSQYGVFFYRGNMYQFLSKYKIFEIINISPLILKLFGIKIPSYFEGNLIFKN